MRISSTTYATYYDCQAKLSIANTMCRERKELDRLGDSFEYPTLWLVLANSSKGIVIVIVRSYITIDHSNHVIITHRWLWG